MFIQRLRFLVATLTLLLIAGSSWAVCPPGAGVSSVDVALIDVDGVGGPDIHSNSKERNEHARISTGLAAQLGLTAPTGDVLPQIRVVVLNEPLANGEPGTGVFSVFEVFANAAHRVEVYANEDPDDEDSGYFRLFETISVNDFSAVDVTVHAQAPSQTTTTVNGGLPSVVEHFCEPNVHAFTEELHLRADKRFALLAPHGGDIEANTGAQITTIETTLSSAFEIDANTWEAAGTWWDNLESEHWHITAKEISEDGFPGFADLRGGPAFDDSRDFQYVASLHGMKFSKEGVVIGGRAHREAKCLVASRMRQRMAAEGMDVPAVYIWNYDKDQTLSIDLAHTDGTKITDPDERGDYPGVSGTSSANIVNRLSPNADGSAGYGGIQIEQSPDLRANGYQQHVSEAIAAAFGELITKPDVVEANSTAICDALIAGLPAPTAEIRGHLWWDHDGDDVQNGSDPSVDGMTVELLDALDAVVATTTTTAGSYGFPRLADGTYKIRVAASPVLTFASQDVGGDDALDSDVDPLSATTADITLAAYEVKDTVDAGLRLRAGSGQIGDFVWLDDDVVDGIQNLAETGIVGVRVNLDDADGVALTHQWTDGGGFYLFDNLPDGDYTLRFTPPTGYQAAPAGQGGDAGLDSDIDMAGSVDVTLNALESDLSVDAGYRITCVDATLVAYGSEWKHSTSLEDDWQTQLFDDGGWSEEQASFGYGGPSVESPISPNGSVVYYRLAFEVEDPSIFDLLDLKLWLSDGAVVYLNGSEVARSNVPVTVSSEAEFTTSISVAELTSGTNVLAVEVHEDDGSSLFDFEMSSHLCRPCLDSVALTLDQGTYLSDGSSASRGSYTYVTMDGSTRQNGLFSWDVSGLPSDAEVLHAEIEWVVDNTSSNPFHVYPMSAAWNETDADWFQASEAPVVPWTQDGAADTVSDYEGDEPLASLLFDDDPPFGDPPYTGFVVLNVSGRELVQSWIRGERDNDGVVVPGEVGSNGLKVLSDDSATPPLLRLVYRSCTP
jgi:hypothetical protein